jgi:hypothetical protein
MLIRLENINWKIRGHAGGKNKVINLVSTKVSLKESWESEVND